MAPRPYRAQELICVAESVDRVPQFSATREWDDRESFERRKRYREQCRLQYRAIMPFGRGQAAAAKAAEHRDGRGNVAVAEAGTPRSSGLSDLNRGGNKPALSTVEGMPPSPEPGEGSTHVARPVSPAIAERAARQGTRERVHAARATLSSADLAAACAREADDTEYSAPEPAMSASEISELLRSD